MTTLLRESGVELDGKVAKPVWVMGRAWPLPTMMREEIVVGKERNEYQG
jgi:hypothetical protein